MPTASSVARYLVALALPATVRAFVASPVGGVHGATISAPGACTASSCRLAAAVAVATRLEVPSHDQPIGAVASLPALPTLDASEELLVQSGKCLRWQQPPSRKQPLGSGFAVQELRADADAVFRAISDFAQYPELISTVRSATAYEPPEEDAPVDEPPSVCRYRFIVSRIRLVLAVRFAVDAARRYASWRLDVPSWVLDDSTGYWRVQPVPERPGVCRVWFCVSVRLNPLVPRFVVGLVSRLGLYKATKWLKSLDEAPPADDGA